MVVAAKTKLITLMFEASVFPTTLSPQFYSSIMWLPFRWRLQILQASKRSPGSSGKSGRSSPQSARWLLSQSSDWTERRCSFRHIVHTSVLSCQGSVSFYTSFAHVGFSKDQCLSSRVVVVVSRHYTRAYVKLAPYVVITVLLLLTEESEVP